MADTYNGWTNYATWRVNLEIFDGFDPSEYYSAFDRENTYDLAHSLKDYATEIIDQASDTHNLARDYALAFLEEVNWREIAEHMIEAYADN